MSGLESGLKVLESYFGGEPFSSPGALLAAARMRLDELEAEVAQLRRAPSDMAVDGLSSVSRVAPAVAPFDSGSRHAKERDRLEGRTVMKSEWLRAQVNKLRAEASRGAVPSSVVFALTDPIMDTIERDADPSFYPCCGFQSDGSHNASCTFYDIDAVLPEEVG